MLEHGCCKPDRMTATMVRVTQLDTRRVKCLPCAMGTCAVCSRGKTAYPKTMYIDVCIYIPNKYIYIPAYEILLQANDTAYTAQTAHRKTKEVSNSTGTNNRMLGRIRDEEEKREQQVTAGNRA